jgi:hypothetical protein
MKLFEQHPTPAELILIVAILFPALAASAQNKPAGQPQFEQGSSEPRPQKYDLEVANIVISLVWEHSSVRSQITYRREWSHRGRHRGWVRCHQNILIAAA